MRNATEIKKALNRKYQNKIGNKAQVPEGECDEDFDHDYDHLKATCDVSMLNSAKVEFLMLTIVATYKQMKAMQY